MAKAVLISIRPDWVKKILKGEKTLEVRKTRPKLETPFKCYIYCTNSGVSIGMWGKHGKVVGEFVCDAIFPLLIECSSSVSLGAGIEVAGTCLTDREILNYLGNGKQGFAWHISGLKIYQRPVSLENCRKPCINPEMPYCPACKVGYEYISDAEAEFYREYGTCDTEWICQNIIPKAPQSWCYIEELGNG